MSLVQNPDVVCFLRLGQFNSSENNKMAQPSKMQRTRQSVGYRKEVALIARPCQSGRAADFGALGCIQPGNPKE